MHHFQLYFSQGICPVVGLLGHMILLRASQVAQVVNKLPANAGDIRDVGLIPGSERAPGVVNGNPLQYFSLKNFMDRAVWWATVHGIAKRQTH